MEHKKERFLRGVLLTFVLVAAGCMGLWLGMQYTIQRKDHQTAETGMQQSTEAAVSAEEGQGRNKTAALTKQRTEAGDKLTGQTEQTEPAPSGEETVNRFDREFDQYPAEQFAMPGEVTLTWMKREKEILRKEEMSHEEAAEIGLRWLYVLWGYDASGKEIGLRIVEQEGRRFWQGGELHKDTLERPFFYLDTVTGKAVGLERGSCAETEKRDTRQQEFSIEDVEVLQNEAWWGRLIRQFMRQTGLNQGKTVDTVHVTGQTDGFFLFQCVCNELTEGTETVEIFYDFVNNEPMIYRSITELPN